MLNLAGPQWEPFSFSITLQLLGQGSVLDEPNIFSSSAEESRPGQLGVDFYFFFQPQPGSTLVVAPRLTWNSNLFLNSQMATSKVIARSFGGTNNLFTKTLD